MAGKPAIEGGKPVRTKILPYGHQSIRPDDAQRAAQVMLSDWITQGPMVERFEEALAKTCGARHAVAVSSGTAALHAACAAAGLRRGDIGVTSALTFSGSANAVVYCGATPAFVDVSEDWPLADVNRLANLKDDRIRCIVPVDYGGHPAPYDELMDLAEDRGWTVVDDAAHALGASYHGRPVGGLGHMTVLSFHPVKHITTGEGGAILTNDDDHAAFLRAFRHHGIVHPKDAPGWFYDIPRLGHNFRITDFQCALGLSQLGRLRSRVARRRSLVRRYNKAFQGLAGLEVPTERPGVESSYHLYPIRLRFKELRVGRERIYDALRSEGLGVQVHYIPVHLLSFYRQTYGFKEGDYPNAETFYEREITLPLFDGMTKGDPEDVIEATEKVFGYYAR
jgi:UDP-4-amino-4,6-dideoxy-N-acetyl-beta-L-altrosamine transaminase